MTQDVEVATSGDAPDRRPTPRSAGHVAIALTVALLGFLLAIQLRAHQDLVDRLSFERESDLGQILAELTARSDRLVEEIIDLRVRVAATSGSQEQARALLENARTEVASLQIMLGTVPVEGPGVVMTIEDPLGVVGPEVLLDAVQELRDAGAEAIDVGSVRVVASTAFAGGPGAVKVGTVTLAPPYVVTAIGAPQTMASAMRIPGGVQDAVAALEHASVRIAERRSVSILSTRPVPVPRHARPRPRR